MATQEVGSEPTPDPVTLRLWLPRKPLPAVPGRGRPLSGEMSRRYPERMADPQLDNVYRAQAIWQGPTLLPEDQFVNSFAFVRDTDDFDSDADEMSDEISERLREFYLEPVAPATNGLVWWLPQQIVAQGLVIKVYDLGQPPPRQPREYAHSVAIPSASSNNALPWEVALTASFYGERNLPRQRGRIYLGPLSERALADGSDARPSAELLVALAGAVERLALGRGIGDNAVMGVLSPTDAEIRPVTAGWVDNAFDTQKRRGNEASSRLVWPAA